MTEHDIHTVAAHGEHTTRGVPNGASSLTPFLTLPRAKEAVEFYRDVFGARVVDVVEMGDSVVHAELDFGNGRLQLGEPNGAYGLVPAPAGEGDCYSLGLYREDADAVVRRAEAAGAIIREPLSTFVSGDRFARIRDPFGVRWSIMTRVEDISEEESTRRVSAWAETQNPPNN
ncbi:VOC family protein [Leifsonia kafniensis]|uniref:VOC family protein n=1 Tax=Leifsonia kafniensis TaxID=475957 RepID=A0ABP7KCC2_9MICO